jgi:hypothetical protein
MRLRPHPESKPPSHLGGGESRAANPRYKLLGQALNPEEVVERYATKSARALSATWVR